MAFIFFVYRLLRTRSLQAVPAAGSITPAIKTQWHQSSFTIGVLTPLPNEAALFLTQGITSSLHVSTNTKYTVLPLTGDNTRVHLFEQATQAIKSCDLLVTYGVTCANIATEACVLLGPIPVINAGLRKSQCHKLTRTIEPALIIVTQHNYLSQAKLFKQLKPRAQNACIMYRNNNETSSEEVSSLKAALESIGLAVSTHVLTHNTHIDNQMSALQKTYDTLFLMPHTVVSKNVQELITYCNSKQITLCSQETDLVILGAALGFGGHEKELGAEIGHTIRNLFESKKKYAPGSVITHEAAAHCTINKTKYEIQTVALLPEYVTLLEQTTLINQPIMTTGSAAEHHSHSHTLLS